MIKYQVGDVVLFEGEMLEVTGLTEQSVVVKEWVWKTPWALVGEERAIKKSALDHHQCPWFSAPLKAGETKRTWHRDLRTVN